MSIIFKEHPIAGYKARTIENAKSDLTIAFAFDFTSAGERLTRKVVLEGNKLYFTFYPESYQSKGYAILINGLFELIEEVKKPISVNIAGNGVYTTINHGWNQESCDKYVESVLGEVITDTNIKSITTGGQTGFDEAGAKAGDKLGIPTRVLAPKGWAFRDINGKDIYNEKLFKARFL